MNSASTDLIPRVQRRRLQLFIAFTRWYVKRNFHAIRVLNLPPPEITSPDASEPVVMYANHPSWWDPLIGLFMIDRFFHDWNVYSPIDQKMLDQYRFFRHLGFYGVDRENPSSVRRFLGITRAILQQRKSMIWVTPQGRFVDARQTDVPLEKGLTRMHGGTGTICYVPVAIEYVFWEERLPEALIQFGSPTVVPVPGTPADHQALHNDLQANLRQSQMELAQASTARDPRAFAFTQRRDPGFFFLYDLWREFMAAFGRSSRARARSHSHH